MSLAKRLRDAAVLLSLGGLFLGGGCAARRAQLEVAHELTAVRLPRLESPPLADYSVNLASHDTAHKPPELVANPESERLEIVGDVGYSTDTLEGLEALAQSMNPRLLRLSQEAAAAEAKTNYVDTLPDPTVGANFFLHPIETASGAQRANLSIMQMIPWLSRLDAQSQQAYFEALALQQAYETARLNVIGDVRALWYRLYVLGKQIETNRANQQILTLLIKVANARLSMSQASQGDVLLGTLELSKLEEQNLVFEQQLVSTKAELNRALGRDTDHPIQIPNELEAILPNWSHGMLRQIAWERQPEIAVAELRTQAANWGIEVARFRRRPDLSLSAGWFAIDDNRPTSNLVDVGQDAWSIGAKVSVPLWDRKYDAIEDEAILKHSAAHASVDEVRQRYDALLRDLWERAKTAHQIAELYQETLLPQARLTLNADELSYSNGAVEFDRVVRGFRSVLVLEVGYHRAVGELAIALARTKQAIGTDLEL
jgi:outer membrane protein TolC